MFTLLCGVLVGLAPPAQADPVATIPISCDRPNGGITNGTIDLNSLIPDPLNSDSLMQVSESADPVLPGGQVQYTIALPFPSMSFPPNDYGVTYGTFYVKSVDITVPIPAGLDVSTVTPVVSPATEYVTASRVNGEIKVHIQSRRTDTASFSNYVRINTEAANPVPEVRLLNGNWVPVSMPNIVITPTVTAAPGSTIVWHPPSRNDLVVYYVRTFRYLGFIILGSVNWVDETMGCTPVDPNQAVATTTVASPSLSVSTSADETAVVAGQPVHLHVTVRNTGDVGLNGVVVSDASSPGCAGNVGSLPVGAQVTRDCTATTSVANIPTFSNTAGADSDETAAVTSNTTSVTVASVASTGVSGQVRDSVSNAGVAGAWVALLRTSDFSIAGSAVADGTGAFTATALPGSYLVYGVDPSGRHTAGFSGPQVAVSAGAMATANPALAPTRGAIAGTVTTQGSGAPVAGAWALASSGTTFAPETLAVADGNGAFRIGDLPTGDHFVTYLDPTGAHAPEYFGDAAGPAGARRATVTGGGTTVADGTPPAQAAAGTGAVLSGVVSESGTGAPLPGVAVVALRAGDFGFVRGGLTNAAGAFSLSVPQGSYKLLYLDTTGAHFMEWHDNQPYTGIASAASVAAPGVVNASLDVTAGTMAGTVTDDPSGTPVAGAWVIAIGPTGIAGGAVTGADGRYSIAGLPAGTYRATFADPIGGRTQEYWNNATSISGAQPITIAGGATTTIDAGLRRP